MRLLLLCVWQYVCVDVCPSAYSCACVHLPRRRYISANHATRSDSPHGITVAYARELMRLDDVRATRPGVELFETSARSGAGVRELMAWIAAHAGGAAGGGGR